MNVRRLTAALVLGTAGLGFLPVASAAPTPTPVATTVEGWFQPNPTCTTPLGCLTPEAVPGARTVTVYPGGTLHVGVSGGQETARTYLGLDAASVTGLSSAKLTVPLDVAPTNGTTTPELSTAQVCLTSAPLAAVEGSLAAPPEADCDRSAVLSYVATPTPRLEADLSPLLEGLGSASGLVLLPDATVVAPTDAWRVVFSARTRTGPGSTAPAMLSVVRATGTAAADVAPAPAPAAVPPVAEVPTDEAPALDVVAAPAVDLPADVAPSVELGEAPLPAAEPLAVEGAPAPETVVAVENVALPQTVRVGYAYPAVWLLPLVLLVGVPAVARVLTRDLTPVRVEA